MPVMMRGHCTLVMMRDLLYASYDEGVYCMPVMMRGVLYASYDEGVYFTPVMMRGCIVRQL